MLCIFLMSIVNITCKQPLSLSGTCALVFHSQNSIVTPDHADAIIEFLSIASNIT